MGEMSKLGWLIGLVKHTIWADSLYFLYLLLLSISNASQQPTIETAVLSRVEENKDYRQRALSEARPRDKTSSKIRPPTPQIPMEQFTHISTLL
jgi:hypothetical protein